MKAVLVSDVHSAIKPIKKLEPYTGEADLTLLLGDVTHFGHAGEAEVVLERLKAISPRILGVSGNCDYPDVEGFLMDHGISLEGRCMQEKDWCFIGLGGSLPAPGTTPNEFTEEQLGAKLEFSHGLLPANVPWILVSHQPPADTGVDAIYGGYHVGSSAVRSFIERCRPMACFSGHIHEARGIGMLGTTFLVNPGSFREGYFATVDLNDPSGSVELHRLS